jgi:hypothetical protein
MSLISLLRSSPGFWEAVEYSGEVLVLVGVILEDRAESIGEKTAINAWVMGRDSEPETEIPLLTKADDERRKKAIRRATRILLVGLSMGLIGIIRTNQLSDERIAALNATAGEAWQHANDLEKTSTGLKLEIAKVNKQAEDERLARTQLEARLAPRIFDSKISAALRSSLSRFTPQNVDILESGDSSDISFLAVSLQTCLSAPGWDVELYPYSPDRTPFRAMIEKVNWLNSRAPEHTKALMEIIGINEDAMMRSALFRGAILWPCEGENKSTGDAMAAIESALKKSGIDCVNLGQSGNGMVPVKLRSFMTCREYRTDLSSLYRQPEKKATIQITILPKE